MLKDFKTFSSFSSDDISKAKQFYGKTLGLDCREEGDMGLKINLSGGAQVFVYPKEDHQPATFTVLNFVVDDIDKTAQELRTKGVKFEEIDFGPEGGATDDKGIMRGKAANQGPDIAWFKDPAGNFLSIIEE